MKKAQHNQALDSQSDLNITPNESHNLVLEPALAYYPRMTVILPNATKKPESQMTAFEKMGVIRLGVSKRDLEHLKDTTELDYEQLAKALSVTKATLIKKKGSDRFGAAISEKIVSLADIYSYGYQVFEDEERFNEWVFRPNKALGNQLPYDLLDNVYGREEVRNVIGRIDYGVFS